MIGLVLSLVYRYTQHIAERMTINTVNALHFIHLLLQATIISSGRKLLDVLMINGKIEANVPVEVAKLPDWKAPVRVALLKGKNGNSPIYKKTCIFTQSNTLLNSFVV